ncbi:hypothetical protein DFA_03508 [Cavenderia fasciculata]|uniref:Uncharacterized protein n=1 Tax=Cavenderia fasciculata TaxID=261658 RepID=F4PHS6_CACFS|nr:uncharacterized protein DFA_03508 [Cavenderia fasciculata]EGG25260.1 hypothetical protein DFA_03508 [Cavenderia fasciculata]|eukprot:XP_004363111.1 hypothetical protein DFA_03508 [Cavenderia fasciculata]
MNQSQHQQNNQQIQQQCILQYNQRLFQLFQSIFIKNRYVSSLVYHHVRQLNQIRMQQLLSLKYSITRDELESIDSMCKDDPLLAIEFIRSLSIHYNNTTIEDCDLFKIEPGDYQFKSYSYGYRDVNWVPHLRLDKETLELAARKRLLYNDIIRHRHVLFLFQEDSFPPAYVPIFFQDPRLSYLYILELVQLLKYYPETFSKLADRGAIISQKIVVHLDYSTSWRALHQYIQSMDCPKKRLEIIDQYLALHFGQQQQQQQCKSDNFDIIKTKIKQCKSHMPPLTTNIVSTKRKKKQLHDIGILYLDLFGHLLDKKQYKVLDLVIIQDPNALIAIQHSIETRYSKKMISTQTSFNILEYYKNVLTLDFNSRNNNQNQQQQQQKDKMEQIFGIPQITKNTINNISLHFDQF